MNTEFITILMKLVTEQGKEVLFNFSKCKAFLADYTRGEYKKECRLLLQTIEARVPKAIDESNELSQCKQQQIRLLHEEFFLTEEIAKDMTDTLSLILRGDKSKLEVPKPKVELVTLKNNKPILEEDKVNRKLEIWTCGRCNTTNDFALDYCKKCKKEFNPPLYNYSNKKIIKLRSGLWER